MALDAAHRSSIYTKLVPILGEDDANVLMSEFPSVEAKELVTKEFLRAELAEFKAEFKAEFMAEAKELFVTKAEFHAALASLETRLTIRIGAAFGACTAILATLNLLG